MSRSDFGETLTDDDAANHQNRRIHKPRRLRRRWILACFASFVLLALFWLNGPGFRLIAKAASIHFAEKQGMKGDLKIEGTLWSGFSLSDVTFSPLRDGPAGKSDNTSAPEILAFQLKQADLSYRSLALLRAPGEMKWLDTVSVEELEISLRLPEENSASPKRPKENSKTRTPQPKDYHPLWNLLASDIYFSKVSLSIEQGDKTYQLDGFEFQSRPGPSGKLAFGSLRLPGQNPVEGLEVNLQKEKHALALGPLPVGEISEIHSLRIAEPTPGVFTAEFEAHLAGGEISAALSQEQDIVVSLKEGSTIDLSRLNPDQSESNHLEGMLTSLSLRFQNPFAEPSSWDLSGVITTEDLGWQGQTFDTADLTITNNTLSLLARRSDAEISVEASIPLSLADSIEKLADLPIDARASVEIQDLAELTRNLETEIPIEGSLSLEARDFQFDSKGNFTTGNILLQSESLSWEGLSLPLFQVAAKVEKPNLLRVAGNVGIDAESRVRLSGLLDTKSLAYEGSADGAFSASGPIGDWIRKTHDLTLSGKGTFNWKGSGSPGDTKQQGEATINLTGFRIDDRTEIETSLALEYEDTRFDLNQIVVKAGDLALTGQANWDGKTIALKDWVLQEKSQEVLRLLATVPFAPEEGRSILEQDGDISVALSFEQLNLDSILPLLIEEPPLSGFLQGNLNASGSLEQLNATGALTFSPSDEKAGANSQIAADLNFTGKVASPQSWDTSVKAEISGLQWKDVALGSAHLAVQTHRHSQGKTLGGKLAFAHAGSTIDSEIQIDLTGADTFDALLSRPIEADAKITLETLAALIQDFAPDKFAGLSIDGRVEAELEGFRLQDRSLTAGEARIDSETLTVAGQQFESIQVHARVDAPNHLLSDFEIALDEVSTTKGSVAFHITDQSYEGDLQLQANLKGEGKLGKLLSGRPVGDLLPRKTELEWNGRGIISEQKHEGNLRLDADSLSLASGAVPIQLQASGSYSESSAEFPDFSLASEVLDLNGSLLWKDDLLTLSNWKGVSEGTAILSLDASVPLATTSLGPQWFEQETPLSLALKLSDLPVAKISRLFLEKAPIRGTLKADISSAGTPALPTVSGSVGLSQMFLPNEKGDIPLGEIQLTVNAESEKASLKGRFQHPDLNPLSLAASLPFFPRSWAEGTRTFSDEPIEATAQMENSSLAFLAEQIPAIESIAGTVGINAALRGTTKKPSISGDGILEVTRLRLGDRNAPSLYDINLSTRFSDNHVTIDHLHAIVAGGEISGKGDIAFESGSEPVFDFQVSGKEVLLFRTPDLSLRTDAELTLSGPWSKASLAGEIGLTNSRFFKNFDLLPRTLPTRNTSVLPTVDRAPSGGGAAYTDLNLGVDIDPFRDWLANVRVYTKTPFLVRSNLVESDLVADLHIGGSLGVPSPKGYLAIDEGELSLPFSSVDVETGRIEFDENTGFNGALEFKARAKVDKYRINVFLYNRVLDPKYVLTSVPPMPTEDLVSLLITGTPRQDLVGEGVGSMAAGKAATLLFKNLRKASAAADQEPNLLDDLQERTELEIGGINPETGEQTIGGKIRLWKQLFFVGDVDAKNDYRAVLKYVFRFR